MFVYMRAGRVFVRTANGGGEVEGQARGRGASWHTHGERTGSKEIKRQHHVSYRLRFIGLLQSLTVYIQREALGMSVLKSQWIPPTH